MTIKDICQVHYFSCVEAYFGAWIKSFVPLPVLYCDSFVSWYEICNTFKNGVDYANFCSIRRIQDFAELNGLVSHKKIYGKIDWTFDPKRLTLVSVNENFFLKQKPWRKDHYIAIENMTPKRINYVNEYPLSIGKMPLSTFYDNFGGDSLLFQLNRQNYAPFYRQSDNLRYLLKTFSIGNPDALPLIALRDALGILRVSRRRTIEWLAWDNSVTGREQTKRLTLAMKEQLRTADKFYLQIQLMILKKRNDNSLINALFSDIRRHEESIKQFAKEEL